MATRERRTSRWRPALAVWLLAAGLPAAALARAAGRDGDVAVTAAPAPQTDRAHGYQELVVAVTNQSRTRSHQVRAAFPRNPHWYGPHSLRSVARTVRVRPGRTERVRLLVPHLSLSGNELE